MKSLEDALDFLDARPVGHLGPSLAGRFRPAIPKRLVQYWDHDRPEQIETLLRHNQGLCQRLGLAHVFYDSRSARSFLETHYPEHVVTLYDRAPHPAIKSDLFRYAELAVNGGWYLDADMALRPAAEKVWSTRASFVAFKWAEGRHKRNICNWFFWRETRACCHATCV